jgi:hypothetical protein
VKWKNKGRQRTSHLTVNGPLELDRTVYWSQARGTLAPLDVWLGMAAERYSVGVREMGCRVSLNAAFAPASATLARTAQLTLRRCTAREPQRPRPGGKR